MIPQREQGRKATKRGRAIARPPLFGEPRAVLHPSEERGAEAVPLASVEAPGEVLSLKLAVSFVGRFLVCTFVLLREAPSWGQCVNRKGVSHVRLLVFFVLGLRALSPPGGWPLAGLVRLVCLISHVFIVHHRRQFVKRFRHEF